jgi:hypothetical protein
MIDQAQPGTKRLEFYVLRISVLDEVSPQKFEWQINEQRELIMAPPQMNSLRMEQQSFQKMVEPFIRNYIVENKLVDDNNDKDNNLTTRSRGGGLRSAIPVPTSNNLTPPPQVVAITLLPMGRKKCNLNDIDPSVTLPDDDDVERLYPHLSHALGGQEDGFDITNPSVVKSMQALLTELTIFLSPDYELKVKDVAKHGHVIHYVRVPITSNNQSFQKDKEWLDAAIQISRSKHKGTFESAYRITNHLIRFYKDSVVAACETQRIPICKPMSAMAFTAMLQAKKVSGTGERELKTHLRAHLGVGFCPTRQSVDMLANGHSTVHYNCIDFMYDGKEKAKKIEWTEKILTRR